MMCTVRGVLNFRSCAALNSLKACVLYNLAKTKQNFHNFTYCQGAWMRENKLKRSDLHHHLLINEQLCY